MEGREVKKRVGTANCLPNDLSVYWQQYPWALGEALCKFRAVVSEMMSYTSVLTIVAFSMERYLAICHPLYSYSMKGLRRALRIIAVLWLVSLVSAAPFAAYTTVSYIDYPPGSGNIVDESAFCAMLNENVPASYPVYELSSLVFFLLPLLVMVVLYVRMGLTIWRPHGLGKRVEGSIHRKVKQNQSRKSIVRMLAAVVVAFFLCWAPFHLQRLLYIYAQDSPNFRKMNEWMYYITGCFYYFSSTVNPILYNVMSAKYRDAFLKTLCCMNSSGRAMARDTSSFQETTIGYSNSVYRHNRSTSNNTKCNRYSIYQDGHALGPTHETAERSEDYCNLMHDDKEHCPQDRAASDVMVVATNGKAESYVTPTNKPARNWHRTVLIGSRTDLNSKTDDSDHVGLSNVTTEPQVETCI